MVPFGMSRSGGTVPKTASGAGPAGLREPDPEGVPASGGDAANRAVEASLSMA